MKKVVVFALLTAALLLPAGQAQAAESAGGQPTLAQFKALEKQVRTLQAQIKTLQKWVPTSCSTQTCATLPQVSNAAFAAFPLMACHDAVVADEFQATWNVIDQISAATQAGKTYFGAQTSITDSGTCAAFRITRPAAIPPTVAIFSSLVTLLTG
jgi:hypothetical protein